MLLFKQGVAIWGHNRTGPPCSVGRPTAQAPGPPAALHTMTDDYDIWQRAKQ